MESNNNSTSTCLSQIICSQNHVTLSINVILTAQQLSDNERICLEIDLSKVSKNQSCTNLHEFVCRFFVYADEYKKRDKRVVKASVSWFKRFLTECSMEGKHIDFSLCNDFRDYLYDHLNGNTPGNYFKKFRAFIDEEVRLHHLSTNPSHGIRLTYSEYREKLALTETEIYLLRDSYCRNEEVKQAFLFSCYCGLRWCDIVNLRAQDIDLRNSEMCIIQQKVATHSSRARLKTYLSPSAHNLIKDRCMNRQASEYIFSLPSYAVMYKVLTNWINSSGILKHITFHCARHTFISMLVSHGVDIKTISHLAGHSTTRHTERYVHSEEKHLRECIGRLG